MNTAVATTTITRPPAPGELRRVLDVARLQALNWPMQFGFPFMLFGVLILINIIGSAMSGGGTGADPFVPFGVSLVFMECSLLGLSHWQTIVQVFSFTLGLGVTRRTFYLATTLVAVVQGVVFSALFAMLGQLERVTGGWGSGDQLFRLGELSPAESFVVYAVTFLVSASIGVVFAAVYKRWGLPGMWVLLVTALVLSGAIAGIGAWLGWETSAAAFLAGIPIAAVLVGGPLVLAVVLGLAGFAVLRRATP